MIKKILFSLILFSLLFISLASAIDISDCSNLNETGQIYYLTQNITNSNNKFCLNITASNVTLNCQGYMIDGNASLKGIGTEGIRVRRDSATWTNATIKNCIINDWTWGIYFYRTYNNTVENLNTSNNQYATRFDYAKFNTIRYFNSIGDEHSGGFSNSENNTMIHGTQYSCSGGGHGCIMIGGQSHYNKFIDLYFNYSGTFDIEIGSGWADSNHYNYITDSTFERGSWIYYNIWLEIGAYTTQIYRNHFKPYTSLSWTVISTGNVIKDNIFDYGTYIDMNKEGNYLYNNFFNGTGINFYAGGANYFNTTKQTGTRIYSNGKYIGGNYWTNPSKTGYSDTCADSNKDGFCDNAYNLGSAGIDYLPLSDEYYQNCTTISGVKDTFIRTYYPDENFNYYWSIRVWSCASSIMCSWGMMGWNLSSLPSSDIKIINTTMISWNRDAPCEGTNIQFYEINGAWTDNIVTWNTKPSQGTYIGTCNFGYVSQPNQQLPDCSDNFGQWVAKHYYSDKFADFYLLNGNYNQKCDFQNDNSKLKICYESCGSNWVLVKNETYCFNSTHRQINETYYDQENCNPLNQTITYYTPLGYSYTSQFKDCSNSTIIRTNYIYNDTSNCSYSFINYSYENCAIDYTCYNGICLGCNDSICSTEIGENYNNCCMDCGCPSGKECYENECWSIAGYTMKDIGEGIGNFLLSLGYPFLIFIIFISMGIMVGVILSRIGKVGDKI